MLPSSLPGVSRTTSWLWHKRSLRERRRWLKVSASYRLNIRRPTSQISLMMVTRQLKSRRTCELLIAVSLSGGVEQTGRRMLS